MLKDLKETIPLAMIFLKQLRKIVVCDNGNSVLKTERLDEKDSFILTDGESRNDQLWHVFRGDFSEEAEKLKQVHGGLIEADRSSKVTLAIPGFSNALPGRIFACLPTHRNEGLPFHINADFFPTNDRKDIIFGDDYQGIWNRSALRAAACAIGNAIGSLPSLIGSEPFWSLISKLKNVADQIQENQHERTFAYFWEKVANQLAQFPVIETTKRNWVKPAEACLLRFKKEEDAIDVLESVGLNIGHEDLRKYHTLLKEDIGVPFLNVKRIHKSLKQLPLCQRIKRDQLPSGLNAKTRLESLWKEVDVLLKHDDKKHPNEILLQEIALAPGRDNALWPCKDVYNADDEIQTIFDSLGLEIPFVSADEAFEPLGLCLCANFSVADAVEFLGEFESSELEHLWERDKKPLQSLFKWLIERDKEIFNKPELTSSLKALRVFPSSRKLHTFYELSLPGEFKDPLGLADLVDLDAFGGRQQFLKDLGMSELDFLIYATSHLPKALAGDQVTDAMRREVALLVAKKLSELKDNDNAQNALEKTNLVECNDGDFRAARECHFDSDDVRNCLGDSAHLALVPNEQRDAIQDLYVWLGVVNEPRIEDIVYRVQELSSEPYSPQNSKLIKTIVEHLGGRCKEECDFSELTRLKTERWLPARKKQGRLFKPDELHAPFEMNLFSSQAIFLDLSIEISYRCRPLLEFLGIQLKPTVGLVVKHLLHCSEQEIEVVKEVYRFLNNKVQDPALTQLRDKKCLFLGDTFYSPEEVFWDCNPFGKYRQQLGESFRDECEDLFKRLGVRDSPSWEDSLKVLLEISDDLSPRNKTLDKQSYSVLMKCWQSIGEALDEDGDARTRIAILKTVKCVPDSNRVLVIPEWIYFENWAGISKKFDSFLSNNVIYRPIGPAGRAMEMAGVRSLRTAVQIDVLNCDDLVDSSLLKERLIERRNQVGRVLESVNSEKDTITLLGRLEEIQCQEAKAITIRYRLRAFNQDMDSDSEAVSAIYQNNEKKLLFTINNEEPSWAAIARELAIALFPEEDPGKLAAGLKDALAPKSLEVAENHFE